MKLMKKKKMKAMLFILSVCFIFMAISVRVNSESRSIPKLSGKVVYHSYSKYENRDSQLYLFDFDTQKRECLSHRFKNVYNAMNAFFNKDGSEIVFMGMEKGSSEEKWDIYIYNFHDDKLENLTKDNHLRNEDPKFSPDGKKVVFKQGHWDAAQNSMVYNLKEINLEDNTVRTITKGLEEDSMPCYSDDGKWVFFAREEGETSKICKVNVDNCEEVEEAYSLRGVVAYYPIVYKNVLYFTRWYSKSNNMDTIMEMGLDSQRAVRLKFNSMNYNCSDPCPVSDKYIIMSSTKGNKGYDLYLADIENGNVWSLDEISGEINDEREQLGASCFIKSIN